MPELRFIYDSSLVEGMRMSNLVTQVINKDKAKQQQFTPEVSDNSESVDGEKEQD